MLYKISLVLAASLAIAVHGLPLGANDIPTALAPRNAVTFSDGVITLMKREGLQASRDLPSENVQNKVEDREVDTDAGNPISLYSGRTAACKVEDPVEAEVLKSN